jgi:hypothetical protein
MSRPLWSGASWGQWSLEHLPGFRSGRAIGRSAWGRCGWQNISGNASEIDAAFEELLRAKADAFITATDPILLDRREQIVSFAL